MRLITFFAVSLLLIISLIVGGCSEPAAPSTPPTSPGSSPTPAPSAPAPAEVIELNWPMELPINLKTSPGEAQNNFINEVQSASNGRVKINVLPGSVPSQEAYDSLISGTGDFGQAPVHATPGRFPIFEMMTIPDFGTVCRNPAAVAWEFWQMYPELQEEIADPNIKVLGTMATLTSPPGTGFGTADKPVRTLEDLKGMKIGNWGMWTTKTLNALGFTVVEVPPPAIYESIQRGIIDGSFFAAGMIASFKFMEVCKYYHAENLLFSPFWFAMNVKTWNSLPPDVQKIIEDTTAKMPDWMDKFRDGDRAIKQATEEYGVEIITLSDEERARWQALQDPIQEEYLAELKNSTGIDGTPILEQLQTLYEKYAEP